MAIKRNKESPTGQPKDPTKPKVVVNDPAENSQPPAPPVPPVKPPTDQGSGGGSGSGGGGGSKKKAPKKSSNPVAQLAEFLREVIVEFRKISWPETSQVIKETWSVLFLVTVITLMVLGFDWVLGHAVFGPLEHFARLHGGGLGTN
ncbi:MAG TPA: preprotein translocase subunit SecE [Drouetiella sp.]